VGERNDNRGGCEQGIAVGARDRVLIAQYERLDTTLRMLIEAGGRSCKVVTNAKQMISGAPEL